MWRFGRYAVLQFIGATFGLCLFLGAFVALWANEGAQNFGRLAEKSVRVQADRYDADARGKLVALHGDLVSDESLGDALFILPGAYVGLERVVEMYAWEELSDYNRERDETTYRYQGAWTQESSDSSQFWQPEGHVNPALPLQAASLRVASARIGVYAIDPGAVSLPEPAPLDLAPGVVDAAAVESHGGRLSGDYIYIGAGAPEEPEIGDLRVHYAVVPQARAVTAFGEVSGERLVPFVARGDQALYRVFFSDREAAIAEMHAEYQRSLWGGRFGGFIMMWCGLFLLLNPLTALMGFLPALQRFGLLILLVVVLPLAVMLSIATVALSFLAHNPLWLILLVGMVLLGVAAVVAGVYALGSKRPENAYREPS